MSLARHLQPASWRSASAAKVSKAEWIESQNVVEVEGLEGGEGEEEDVAHGTQSQHLEERREREARVCVCVVCVWGGGGGVSLYNKYIKHPFLLAIQ